MTNQIELYLTIITDFTKQLKDCIVDSGMCQDDTSTAEDIIASINEYIGAIRKSLEDIEDNREPKELSEPDPYEQE